MIELQIIDAQVKHKIKIEKYKVLLSQSHRKRIELIEIIKRIFTQSAESEYEQENGTKSMLINEVAIDHKNSCFIEIHPFMDLDQFFKLTSKSLVTKFVEASLDDIEFNDLYQTLNYVYDLISDEIIESKTLCEFDDIKVNYKLSPLGIKQIIKLLELQIVKKESFANEMDLTNEERTVLYLKFIKMTAERKRDLNFYVVLNCFSLNRLLMDVINSFPNNVTVIINAYEIKTPIIKENIYLIGKNFVDFMSDEDIFDKIMMNFANTNDLTVFKEELDRILSLEIHNINTSNLLSRI